MTTTTAEPTLSQVLDLARKLSASDRAELVSLVVRELASAPSAQRRKMTPEEAHAAIADIREEFRRQGPTSPTMAEQLEIDRQSRDDALMGRVEERNVHP